MKSSGTLYIIATPIGNLEDITLRALRILREVDYIAAEDTRHSSLLLRHYEINIKLISYHDFNEEQASEKIVELLQQGANIALISDAGTPMISDPGYRLINEAYAADIKVVPIPGASALITALSVSGLPTNEFKFCGFLPAKAADRRNALIALQNEQCTLVFYEAPHRIFEMVSDCAEILGEQRLMVFAKELTKQFETIKQGNIVAIQQWLQEDQVHQKGEFVVMVAGASVVNNEEIPISKILAVLAKELPPSKAAALGAKITGLHKHDIYECFLKKSD